MPKPAAQLRELEVEGTHWPPGKRLSGTILNNGRNIAATIKVLGYPARDSLRVWIHKLHPELHTRVVGRSDGLARPPAKKQAAVIALRTRQESPTPWHENWAQTGRLCTTGKFSYSSLRHSHP